MVDLHVQKTDAQKRRSRPHSAFSDAGEMKAVVESSAGNRLVVKTSPRVNDDELHGIEIQTDCRRMIWHGLFQGTGDY